MSTSPAPLRLIPLGGLGEIGMNCMAIEHGGDILVLDCGVTFDARGLGIDLIHADLTYLLERRSQVRGLVLTHGHEDHVGAVSWLLRDLSIPVWGPPYAMALVRHRIAEHPFHDIAELDLRTMAPGVQYGIGPFSWELWSVTHSIPDSFGLVLRTPAGTLLHSGDFKIDRSPPFGDKFDFERVSQIAREGVRILLADSTNALAEGRSGGEVAVAEALDVLVREAPARVVIGLFASNVRRIRALLEVARASGRKVVALGRSVETHLRIGQELGVLDDLSDVLVPKERARTLAREHTLVIATGSQGEAPAALPRLAAGTHPDLELGEGDRVILSARIIPGNERAVIDLINGLERRGIPVLTRTIDPRVHVSGHAHRDELRELISMVRPRAFLPVHGTFVHLRAHGELARELGVPEVRVIENGTVLEIDDHGTRIAEKVHSGRVHIDQFEPLPARAIRDRQLLAELGMVLVTLVVDRQGRLEADPTLITRGVIDEEAEPELVEDLEDDVRDSIASLGRGEHSDEALREAVRRAVRRFFVRELGRKPLCYVVVTRLGAPRKPRR